MARRTALLFCIVAGGSLLGTGVRADMDCMDQNIGGRVYNVCKTEDGEIACSMCKTPQHDCTSVPCPPGAH